MIFGVAVASLVLLGIAIVVVAVSRKKDTVGGALIALSMVLLSISFEPWANDLALYMLAICNGFFVGIIATKAVPRFGFLIGLLALFLTVAMVLLHRL